MPAMPCRWYFRRRQRRPAEFAALFKQIHTARLELEQAAGGLETQFLNTSSELERLAKFGDEFVRQVELLIGLATGKNCDNTVFIKSIGLVEQTISFLSGCERETGEMLGLLQSYQLQIQRLLGVESDLQQAMLPLSIVQTLFRMESAPLGLEVQQLFGALTQEIGVLHGQMRELFGTKFKQLEQTRQTIGLVIEKLERQVTALRQVTTVRSAQIESSLATLKAEMLNNQERDSRLDRLTRDLSAEVGQVVVGLQFQDIVNQKLQHVLASMPQIAAKSGVLENFCDSPAVNAALQFIRQSCRLEAGQLQLAQQEMSAAEGTIRSGIEKVLGHLNEMDSRCLSLEEFGLLTTSFDGIVQVLIETIEEVRHLVAATVTNAAQAYELLRPLGSLASDLTAVIRVMSAQIHLIGLNAQVKAAQATQGRRGEGLEVLSARTSDISQETIRISGQAAAQLDQLAAGLAHGVQAFEQLQANARIQQMKLEEQGGQYEQQLHAIRNDALAALQSIGQSLEDIEKQARHSLESISFSSFHQVTLPALRAPLVTLGEAADHWLRDHNQEIDDSSLVDGFQRNYTMASERKVFAGIFAAGQSNPPAAAPDEPQSGNLELFEDDPGPAAEISPIADERKLPEPVAAAGPGAASLGDNVELF